MWPICTSLVSKRSPYLFLCLAAFAVYAPALFAQFTTPKPDPCLETTHPNILGATYQYPLAQLGAVSEFFSLGADPPNHGDNGLVYYPFEAYFNRQTPVVLIIHANPGTGGSHYHHKYWELMEHLARNGFIAVSYDRFNNAQQIPPRDFITDVQQTFGLDADAPVAIIGHSFGGTMAVEAAMLNWYQGKPLNLQALVGLSPVSEKDDFLDPTAVPAYFALYGSRDQDTLGWSVFAPDVPAAAHAAYDRAGVEFSTEGTQTFTPMHKSMAFVYGATHDGWLTSPNLCYPHTGYFSYDDMTCIAKAYLTGFLRWRIFGQDQYEGMFRGAWKPGSVAAMTTTKSDGWGNPEGSPVRLFTQFSSEIRRVVNHFDGPDVNYTKSPSLQIARADSMLLSSHSPHDTVALRVTWQSANVSQYLRFTVPEGQRDLKRFKDLAFRVGQVHSEPGGYLYNPYNQDQDFKVWLTDEHNNHRSVWASQFAAIPFPDRYELEESVGACSKPEGDYSKSAMQTVLIDLDNFSGIDQGRIKYIWFEFTRNTFGRILLDNVEFQR